MNSKYTKWIIAGMIVFMVAVVSHLTSLNNYYVLDDFKLILQNDFISKWENVTILFNPKYLFNPYPIKCGARPLTVFSLMLDYQVWGYNYFGYHLANLLLHGINSVAVLVLAAFLAAGARKGARGEDDVPPDAGAVALPRETARSALPLLLWRVKERFRARFTAARSTETGASGRYTAFSLALLAALIFALHPIQGEVVNIPSFRADLLVMFFYVAALAFFIHAVDATRLRAAALYVCAGVFFLLGLFSKEIAITLPLTAFLYLWVFKNKKLHIKTVGIILVLAALSALFLLLFWKSRVFYALHSAIFPNIKDNVSPLSSVYAYASTILLTFSHYVKTVFFPAQLAIDYQLEISRTIFCVRTLCSALLMGIFAGIFFLTRNKLLRFGMGLWFFSYLPVSNIIPLVNTVNDRYMYLPLVGFCLFASDAFLRLPRPGCFKKIPCNLLAALLVVGAYGVITVRRNPIFENSFTLYSAAVKRTPDNLRVRFNLGLAHMMNENFPAALGEFEKVTALNPLYKRDDVWHLTGMCHEQMGDILTAKRLYARALLLNPRKESLNNYANILGREGDIEGAIWLLNKSLEMIPDPFTYNNVGIYYAQKGEHAKAVECFSRSVEMQQDYVSAWFNLLHSYHQLGDNAMVEKETYRMVTLFSRNGWIIGPGNRVRKGR